METKFKVGDKVLVKSNGKSSSAKKLNGQIGTVTRTNECCVSLDIEKSNLLGLWNHEVELINPELQDLVDVVNKWKQAQIELTFLESDGKDALKIICEKHKGKTKYQNHYCSGLIGIDGLSGLDDKRLIEIIPAPKLVPFTVTVHNWEVKLVEELLYIGCKSFIARALLQDLKTLTSHGDPKELKYSNLRAYEFGIFLDQNGVPWSDVIKIIRALENIGF